MQTHPHSPPFFLPHPQEVFGCADNWLQTQNYFFTIALCTPLVHTYSLLSHETVETVAIIYSLDFFPLTKTKKFSTLPNLSGMKGDPISCQVLKVSKVYHNSHIHKLLHLTSLTTYQTNHKHAFKCSEYSLWAFQKYPCLRGASGPQTNDPASVYSA